MRWKLEVDYITKHTIFIASRDTHTHTSTRTFKYNSQYVLDLVLLFNTLVKPYTNLLTFIFINFLPMVDKY